MTEKAPKPKKMSMSNTKQELLEAYDSVVKDLQEKRAAELKPERNLEEKKAKEVKTKAPPIEEAAAEVETPPPAAEAEAPEPEADGKEESNG